MLRLKASRVLFERRFEQLPWNARNYDVTADGERFLMLKSDEENLETTNLILVENWFDELQRLVPTP